MNRFFKYFLISISIIIIIEITLKVILPFSTPEFAMWSEIASNLKKMPSIYSENFCDPDHRTSAGEILFAKCVDKNLKMQLTLMNHFKKKLWVAGASTTIGFTCNSNTSWPLELKKMYPQIKLNNLAVSGISLREMYDILNQNFESKKFPDVLILGNASPTLDAISDKWSPHSLPLAIKRRALIANAFMMKKFYIYNWISGISNFNSWFLKNKFVIKYPYSATNETSHDLLLSTILQISTEQQEIYIKKLAIIAKENNFQMFCINLPYIDSLSPPILITPKGYSEYHKLVENNKVRLCRELGIPNIDIQKCFNNANLRTP